MDNPVELKGANSNHLSNNMVEAIYKGGKEPERLSDIDEDIMIYKKAISFCKHSELKERLKDSLIILQEKKINGIQ